MAGERRLYLGSDATDARYLIEDPGPNGDFVITDLDDGSRDVLRYDSVDAIAEVLDLSVEQLEGASGTVVYDDATQTVGDGTTSANHESVSADEILSSHRQGDTVYYDPTDRGPYVDLQDAIADVPSGGLLRLAGETFDPSTEGRLVVDGASKPFNVRGVPGDIQDDHGTIFENVGSQAVTSGPIIDIDGGSTAQRFNIHAEGVHVENDASVTHVRVRDAPLTKLRSVRTDADPSGQTDTGIYVTGDSYSTSLFNCGGFADNGPGIHIDGQGSNYVLVGTGANSRNGWGIKLDSLGVRTYGGQFGGSTGGALVTGNNIVMDSPNFEDVPIGVQFGDSEAAIQAEDSQVNGAYNAGIGDAVARWESSFGCGYINPSRMVNPVNTTTAFTANADASSPYVEGNIKTFKFGADFSAATGESGTIRNPHVVSTGERDGLINIPGLRVYNAGDGNWYRNDGTGWATY